MQIFSLMNLTLSIADQIAASQDAVNTLTTKLAADQKTYAALGGATPA